MITKSKITWWAALAASGAVGVALLAASGPSLDANGATAETDTTRAAADVSPQANSHHSVRPGADEDLESRWQVGARMNYEGDYSSWLDQTDVGSDLVAITASGALALTVVKDDGKERLLAVSLAKLALSFTGGQADLVTSQQIRTDIEHSFYVRLSHVGVVPGLYLPRGRSPHSDRLMRNIAGVLQYVSAREPNATHWSVEEVGVEGRYLAHYRKGAEGVEKRKDKAVLSDAAPEGTKVDSASTYRLDAQGVIEHVVFTENVSIPFGMKKVTGYQNISLALQKARLTTVSIPNLADYDFTPLDGTAVMKGATIPGEPTDAELAAGQTFAGLTREMAKHTDGDREQYLAARERLIALLRTDPSTIAECVEALRGQLSAQERASLLGALGDAASPAAQSALIDLAKDPSVPVDTRQGALINVSLTDTPTEGTVDALAAISKDGDPALRAQATLALGAASGTAQQGTDPAAARAAERAIADLESSFQSAASNQDKLTYAGALGNVGGDAALHASQAAIENEDEAIRAQGATSLRLVEDSSADSMLAQLLVDDPSPFVRSRAASATHFRGQNGELLAALDAAARTDEDLSVRHSALSAVSAHVPTSDEARATVEWMAENEPDEGLRDAARDALIDPSTQPTQPAAAEPEATTEPSADEATEE